MKENSEEYITSHVSYGKCCLMLCLSNVCGVLNCNVFQSALQLVDLPGQERLRNKFFDQYKNSAKAIVYVIDSVTIQKEIRDVAEYVMQYN